MVERQLLTKAEKPFATPTEEPWAAKLQIRQVLCPVDFSDFSRRAFRYAAGIARHFQARLFVQHTVQISPHVFLEGADPAIARGVIRASVRECRDGVRRLITGTGVSLADVDVVVNDGDIRDRILQTIAEQKIDLLVMGTHGRKGFNRLMLGSVAERVVHETVCPVLVVSRPQTDFVHLEDEQEPVHIKTILAATDFSRNSDRALTHALRWATEWSAKVVLFHAVEIAPPAMRGIVDLFPEYNPYFEKQVAEAWEKIRVQIPEAAQRKCELGYEVRQGNAKVQILKLAEEKKPDLIVMGARGLGRAGMPWGSTISEVVRDGRFPVLAIRHLID